MWRCWIGLLAAVIALCVCGDAAWAATDDDGRIEYASLYAGNLHDQDVYEVARCLDALGWTRYITGSSLRNQVRWWSITGDNPTDPAALYSDGADLLYYSTHGASNEDVRETRQRTLIYMNGSIRDRLYADGGDAGANPCITPSGWRTPGLQTFSRWNQDLEWVVLASCNQLEYWGASEDGAHEYARAMLGYPRRVHSIWGYHEWAPEAPLYGDGLYRDTKIARDFLISQSFASGYEPIDWAWESANEAFGIPHWSGLRHAANQGETIWRPLVAGGGWTTAADTSVWTPPRIEFVFSSWVYSRDVL